MKDYQQRVISEKMELNRKISLLAVFLTGEEFKALSNEEQERLQRQHRIMEEYSKVLGERMATF